MTVSAPLVLLFTDFGTDGPYLGQMEAAVLAESLQSRVVNLMSDAPAHDARRSAYLLGALVAQSPPGCVVAAVVDPGVGGARRPLMAEVDGRVFVGPDNGLLSQVIARGDDVRVSVIDWRPENLSNTFHGRDLFAPVAGFLSRGQGVTHTDIDPASIVGADWPDELNEVLYVDRFGNLLTGLRAERLDAQSILNIAGQALARAETYETAHPQQACWMTSSCGLVEIVVAGASAASRLGVTVGESVMTQQ